MTNHKRTPEIEARIQRLVGAISLVAPASNIETAWSNISAAVTLAEQGEIEPWKIDPLTAKEVSTFADGSVRIPQLGHWLYINANGAFGVKDLWTSQYVVMKAGANGAAFLEPQRTITKPTTTSSL